MELFTKHYIRIDSNNYIIKGFTDAFNLPDEQDIFLYENNLRHFEINGFINPNLFGNKGEPLFKYENEEVLETTQAERQAYIDNLPPQPKSEIEILKETIETLKELTAYQEIQNRL